MSRTLDDAERKIKKLEKDLDYVKKHCNERVKEANETLEYSKGIIQDQNKALSQITFVPRPCAVVLHHEKNGKTSFISFQNQTMKVGVDPKISKKLKSGDTVALSKETMAIIEMSEDYKMEGPLVFVDEIIGDSCKVDYGGYSRLLHQGDFKSKLKKGDRVIADDSCSVVMRNLGKVENTYNIVKSTGVTWDEIGGLHEAKREITEAIIEPVQEPDLYKFYGRTPCKGILLYGPPRCGKTLLVKATTTAVRDAFGSKAITSGFIYIKGPEILSKYVGVAEERISQLFRRTREHKKKHGFPAVLFIDEAEAILSKRGTGISSDVNNTIVPAFLSEMDGLEETGAVIILATNRSDILDPAVVQEGRIDKKIHVGRPDQQSAIDIFNVHMRNIPLGPESEREQLVEIGASELFCPKKKMYKVVLKDAKKRDKYFTFGNLCSGGMIAEIVQNASSHAMRRNKEEKTKRKHWGITSEDIKNAVRNSFIQNYHINHTDDITRFVEGFRNDVKSVEKVTA